MVFTALLVEGGLAFGIAAVLATWSQRHFAPRGRFGETTD